MLSSFQFCCMTFKEFIECCANELNSPSFEIVLTTAWTLWKAPNDLLWNERVTTVSDLCHQAATAALDYLETRQLLRESVPLTAGIQELKWKPPADANYKLNISCRSGVDGYKAGIGVIIRDSTGYVAAAKSSKIPGVGSTLQVYAGAVVDALQFAYSVGLRRIEFEVGNKELLRLIQSGPPCLASIGVLIEDIWSWVPLFHSLSFNFVSIDCNKAFWSWLQRLCPHLLIRFGWMIILIAFPLLYRLIHCNTKFSIVSIQKKKK